MPQIFRPGSVLGPFAWQVGKDQCRGGPLEAEPGGMQGLVLSSYCARNFDVGKSSTWNSQRGIDSELTLVNTCDVCVCGWFRIKFCGRVFCLVLDCLARQMRMLGNLGGSYADSKLAQAGSKTETVRRSLESSVSQSGRGPGNIGISYITAGTLFSSLGQTFASKCVETCVPDMGEARQPRQCCVMAMAIRQSV